MKESQTDLNTNFGAQAIDKLCSKFGFEINALNPNLC